MSFNLVLGSARICLKFISHILYELFQFIPISHFLSLFQKCIPNLIQFQFESVVDSRQAAEESSKKKVPLTVGQRCSQDSMVSLVQGGWLIDHTLGWGLELADQDGAVGLGSEWALTKGVMSIFLVDKGWRHCLGVQSDVGRATWTD